MAWLMRTKKNMNRQFTVDNIVFTSQQFSKAVKTLPEFNVILWDEAMLALATTEAITAMQTTIRKLFTTIRKKRLMIILVIPYVFQLQKYFASSRAQLLIHHYSPDNLKRGFWELYSKKKMKKLYVLGKRSNDTYVIRGDIRGRFKLPNEPLIDQDLYDKKKEEAIQSIGMDEEAHGMSSIERKSLQAKHRNALLYFFYEKLQPKNKSQFYRWIKKNIPYIKWSSSVSTWAKFGKEEYESKQKEKEEKD
jgi:hypothetical protein